jgi:hypothetical protein
MLAPVEAYCHRNSHLREPGARDTQDRGPLSLRRVCPSVCHVTATRTTLTLQNRQILRVDEHLVVRPVIQRPSTTAALELWPQVVTLRCYVSGVGSTSSVLSVLIIYRDPWA